MKVTLMLEKAEIFNEAAKRGSNVLRTVLTALGADFQDFCTSQVRVSRHMAETGKNKHSKLCPANN